jgi:hypothetical protein
MKVTEINGDMLKYYSNLLNDEKVMRIKELWIEKAVSIGDVYLEMIKDYEDLIVITHRFKRDKPFNYYTQGHVLITAAMLYYKDYSIQEWVRFTKKYKEDEGEQLAYDEFYGNLGNL